MIIFFFKETATTEIYTLSLHDALPISLGQQHHHEGGGGDRAGDGVAGGEGEPVGLDERRRGAGAFDEGLEAADRSEEHTSELQSRQYLVCRLLLEKKNYITYD